MTDQAAEAINEQPDIQIAPKSEQPNRATLYAKKAAVMGELSQIAKGGKVESQKVNYSYATAEAVAEAVRPAMAVHGLSLTLDIVNVDKQETLWRVDLLFTLGCGETGATETSRYVGFAYDNQDKGFNKAVTSAEKYFLMKTFILSSGDDADADAQGAPKPAPEKKTEKAKPKQTAAAKPKATNGDDWAWPVEYQADIGKVIARWGEYADAEKHARNIIKKIGKAGMLSADMDEDQIVSIAHDRHSHPDYPKDKSKSKPEATEDKKDPF